MSISAEDDDGPLPRSAPPIETLPYGALLVSRKGEVLAVNPVAADVLARLYGRSVRPGHTLADSLGTPDRDLAADIRAAASGGSIALRLRPDLPPLRVEVGASRDAGAPFLLTIGPPSRTDRAFSALRRQLSDSTAAAARERQLRRQIEDSHAALERFASVAAHDLRQPLRNIELLLQFLTEDFGPDLPQPALDLVGRARSSAQRLEKLIASLLDHARAGTEAVDPVPVDLDALMDEIEMEFGPAFAAAGATLRRDGPLGHVAAAPVLLRQSLENLIGNAVKYAQPGRPPVVTIARRDNGRTLEIADNGRGFAQEEAGRLFAPFVRLQSDSEIEGSGIGLANVRTIVERHGWTIRAEGEPGNGATFRISGLRTPAGADPPERPGAAGRGADRDLVAAGGAAGDG
ncbi:sensor histidine kinase [Wenxinia marina]|uniref:histidine kinase n=1 Tax=Wenxinia marina DSM 24838 TaxID=1123501 RepID=A0A0D0QDN6_9RHOB|nr:ATP-binding protein [Wenxinia marina]KIQ70457.1 Bacteriophytochrome (light-regulated signal transduction histidine kinase) [Wenxinia marina DSM 24838]GGL52987.1 hypothetical protein GCM10011392_04200 [Wenxinia marina]